MKERKRPDGRKTWHPVYRTLYRFGRGCWHFFVGPFLTKHDDGTTQASWTAVAGALMLGVIIFRMMPRYNVGGVWVFAPVAWPDVFIAFVTLYVKPINDAMKSVAAKNPEKIVEALIGRMGVGDVGKVEAGDVYAQGGRRVGPEDL